MPIDLTIIFMQTQFLIKNNINDQKLITHIYPLPGESSPSSRILKRIPTENLWLMASRYLFKPTINWIDLEKKCQNYVIFG